MGCADEIVFRESKTNGIKSTMNCISHSMLDTIMQIEVDSLRENNSLENSAWESHTKYRKDVRKLVEKDSKDETRKSGVVSQVTLNESKA